MPESIMQTYEHRISPTDPCRVETRRANRRRRTGARGEGWKCYMQCDSPQQALRVLGMLRPDMIEAQVYP